MESMPGGLDTVEPDRDSPTVTALGLAALGFLLGLFLEWQLLGTISGEFALILATAGGVWPFLRNWDPFY